tara:strand:- start:302 stop:676 length:375 start_codon:yes stop_codon:yes gene_type:complete
MGRYYNGDIEGKFWFGVQSSDDADNFGVEGQQPTELGYYFETKHIPSIKEGIAECKTQLKEFENKLNDYFEKNNGYNDENLAKHLEISEKELKEKLTYFARLRLGNKILKCVEKNGSCEFTAEC